MRCGSLFSGIGGMDHGLAKAGFTHEFFCESDPWRRTILARHWPGVHVYHDVRDVDVWQRVDILAGGFPCQDVSVAGRRAGLAGERSGLFFEFARIVDAVRPRWLLVENVPGLLSSNGGRDFGVVLGTLADLGYGVGWRILDSRFFGVPQRRRRVFVVGAVADGDPRGAAERAGAVLAVGTRCGRHSPSGAAAGQDVAVASLSGLGTGGPDDNDGQGGRLVTAFHLTQDPISGDVAPAMSKGNRQGTSTIGIVQAFAWQQGDDSKHGADGRGRSWIARAGDYTGALGKSRYDAVAGEAVGVRRLTPTECERLQALPDGWTLPGPDSRRYAALGDAVTSSVAEWIGRRIGGAA